MRLLVSSVEKRTVISPLERDAAIATYRQTDRISIRNGGARIPAGVIKIFFSSAIDNPRRHRPAVIKAAQLAETQHRTIMDINNSSRVMRVKFEIRSYRSIAFVSRSKVEAQSIFIDTICQRQLSMAHHPIVIMVRRKDDSSLFPLWNVQRVHQKSMSLLDTSLLFAGLPL